MAGDYWEDAVYSVPPLALSDRIDATVVFDWIEANFSFDGGKIDWRLVSEGHAHWRIDDERMMAEKVIGEIRERISAGSAVEHAGDGLSSYGVRYSADDAASITNALLEIPEHHYFLAEDRAWIMVVSTEGDLDVLDRFKP
ncbi:hypothetical protein [Streptomyces sp. CB02613]|uniref:hypothetical protein n=1 Tax=Streptomyces sp. CB02613 TaxID=2020328 RepID=UPI00131BC2DE|nr:hypothetical protein [Streptomyces sp. CB02613]